MYNKINDKSCKLFIFYISIQYIIDFHLHLYKSVAFAYSFAIYYCYHY